MANTDTAGSGPERRDVDPSSVTPEDRNAVRDRLAEALATGDYARYVAAVDDADLADP